MAVIEIRMDSFVLDLLADDEELASCLIASLKELRHGRTKAERTHFGDVYFYDACGFRLWMAMNPARTIVRITGYTDLRARKHDE